MKSSSIALLYFPVLLHHQKSVVAAFSGLQQCRCISSPTNFHSNGLAVRYQQSSLQPLLASADGDNEEEDNDYQGHADYPTLTSSRSSDEALQKKPTAKAKPPAPLSKLKWKKKRHLMMQDVMALIEKGDPRAPTKAQEIIRRMQKLSKVHQDDDILPNEQVYNLWINAISKCVNDQNAGQQAEAVLEEMRNAGLEPNVRSYTSVMDAYARSSGRFNRAAHEAERVLFDLLEKQQQQPYNYYNNTTDDSMKITSITCDTVLKAWANRGDVEGAERAQVILDRLELLQNDDNIRPTVHSYGTVIHAWATCNGGSQAAENAEAILNRLLRPDSKVKADTVVFNSAINAWANSRDPQAGTRAVQLLKQMRELHNPQKGIKTAPDSVTYNTVLAAWSHSEDMSAATETERVLKEMQDSYKQSPQTSPAPNTVSFNSVLHAWSKSPLPGAVERAQAVLEFMIKANKQNIAPDVISFTSVLNALAKSKDPDKSLRARKLLDIMLNMYDISKRKTLKPSSIPFNAVLNACAFSASDTTDEQKEDALKVAVLTFSDLQERARPDTVSYGNLMKCYHNLMPPGERRNALALKLFDNCKTSGLVGELVWTEVRRTVQSRVLSRAMEDMRFRAPGPPSSLLVTDLPRSWTKNVRGDKLAARRRSQAQSRKIAAPNNKDKYPVVRRPRSISEPSYQSGKDV